jgi:hypothetical protein
MRPVFIFFLSMVIFSSNALYAFYLSSFPLTPFITSIFCFLCGQSLAVMCTLSVNSLLFFFSAHLSVQFFFQLPLCGGLVCVCACDICTASSTGISLSLKENGVDGAGWNEFVYLGQTLKLSQNGPSEFVCFFFFI